MVAQKQAPAPTRSATRSLVVTPAVVAHRGASGHRPEHTLDAYRTAIRMGVDDIELDLVITADGVLVARHENELSLTTDVAERPELAHHRTTRVVDGRPVTGWFTEDLTLAEVKRLAARERHPELRAHSASHDGVEGVPTFNEVLAAVGAEASRRGRTVGLMVELKHPSHFAARGLPLVPPLLADLARHGLADPRSRVSVMSFETGVLRELAGLCRLPLVQLLEEGQGSPRDLELAGDPRTWADLVSPEGLAWISEYADGLGVARSLVLPRDPEGRLGAPTDLVRRAHRHWLTVHVWTLRAENRYLPSDLRGPGGPEAHGGLAAEVRAFLAAGVDGVITDHPDLAVPAVQGLGRRAKW
ncbi:glycerophosphodiester phosphodiesterase family protein [Nocardioides houyundeii]|uniref:glycerophosphodiester phosphodiesterase family protein n=1 Tax=Nocardioides houyundeii TaxID=2045452 RepID=UPI0013B45490|nr:glycerophosphodiester phosphodiesterase family protein [Nocardioides houyundeii]